MFQIVKIVATMEYFLVHYNPVLSDRVKFHSSLCTELLRSTLTISILSIPPLIM